MDGQADTAPVSADEVARFLVDNPDSDRADDTQEAQPSGASPEQDTDEPDNVDGSPEEGDEGEEPDDAPEQPQDPTSGRKFKVTVKGEDGADLEQEVDEKELIAGYQRHADYTRKTQELARREEQATEVVKAKVAEAQTQFVQQAQMAQAAVLQLAGLKSPQEMMALAQADPAGYVAEMARADQVRGVLTNIQNQIQQAQFQQQQERQQEMQQAYARCWGVIGQKGIDKPKLQHIFETVMKDYGVPQERFSNLNDPALVLIMNDAVAYRELQRKKAEVTKKAADAPRLPQKQSVPRNDTREKRQVERLRSGRGSRDDLAAFIARNNL